MFICDGCGQCCRNLKNNNIYSELDNGFGICIYFNQETNLCLIYEDRPIICRIDETYDKYFSDIINKDEYYKLNYEACKILKKGI